MITATLTTHDTISSIIATASAEAQVGSNGSYWGASELALSTSSSSTATGRVMWDVDPDDGITTTWKDSSLSFHSGSQGSATWDPGTGSTSMTSTTGSTGPVQKVQIRSMVQAAAEVDWRSISVTFYKNGVATDSYTRTSGPSVDKSASSGGVFAEQILEVASDHTDNDAVVVAGEYRLLCPEGVYPDAGDLAAQVFVFCANAI